MRYEANRYSILRIFNPAALLSALCLIFSLPGTAQDRDFRASIRHDPVEFFTHGEEIDFTARIEGEVEKVLLHYRGSGIEEFQVRRMTQTAGAGFTHQLETEDLANLVLEYYLEALINGESIFLPAEAPQSVFTAEGRSREGIPDIPEDLPAPQSHKKSFEWPLNITGSVDYPVWEDGPVDEPFLQSAGNIALDMRLGGESQSYGISANTSYTNHPLPGQNPFNLSNMLLTLSAKHHSLRVGDLFIQETEYTATGLGRRGFSYAFDNRKIQFGIFNVQSQQVRGFDGFGVPKPEVSLIGGTLGMRFFEDKMSLKAVYVDGKDDPRQGANVGASFFNAQARKGRVFSLSPEGRFLRNKLTMGGEFALSNYDGDLSDDHEAQTDHALRFGGNVNLGRIQIQSTYRRIGKYFHPIGQQYFTKDRLGHNTHVSASLGRLNIMGSFSVMRDNVGKNPEADTTENQAGNLNINWAPSRWLSLTLGYQANRQETTRDTGLILFNQDMRMNMLSGGLSITVGSSMVLTFQASETDQSSRTQPAASMNSRTFNLGGMFRGGQFVTFNPSISYTHSRNPFADQDMRMLGSFALLSLQLIREVLSTTISGSFSRTETAGFGASENIQVSGYLNLHLRKLIRIGTLVLSGLGSFRQTGMGDFTQTTTSAALKCDFSF